jgi:hypothetical protein
MHVSHDYPAKLLADAKMRDFQRMSANRRLVRELRIRYRRQLILWLSYMLNRAGKSLLAWSEHMEGRRTVASDRGYPVEAGDGATTSGSAAIGARLTLSGTG